VVLDACVLVPVALADTVAPRIACFLSQQAAEKALRA